MVGLSSSFGDGGEEDVYLVKLNASGEEKWSQTYGGEKSDVGHSVAVEAAGLRAARSLGSGGFLFRELVKSRTIRRDRRCGCRRRRRRRAPRSG
jgi:hypothetical protein